MADWDLSSAEEVATQPGETWPQQLGLQEQPHKLLNSTANPMF